MTDRRIAADGITEIAGDPLITRVLDRVGRAIGVGSNQSSLFWYAVCIVFLEVVVLQGFNAVTGRRVVFFENPLWLVRPLILLTAAVATHSLLERYESAVVRSKLLERSASPDRFKGLVPTALSATIVTVGVVFTVVNAVFLLTIPQIYAAGGPARVFRFLVITPFGYVPILGTFLATYVSIEVLLPRRVMKGDVTVDFLDPENLGGMRPIGELVKYAYYFVMVGLVGYAVATYGPYVFGGVFAYEELSPPGTLVNAAFTVAWGAAVATMAYGIYVLHRFMVREKRQELHRLDMKAREQLDEPWDIRQFDAVDLPEAYQNYREQVNYVTSTKEYPATFTMWTQMLIGVMIPKALQLLLSGI